MANIYLDTDTHGEYIKHNDICYKRVGPSTTEPATVFGAPDETGFADCDDCEFDPPVFFGEFDYETEEEGSLTAFTATATDTDTYEIIEQRDEAFFNINPVTGEIVWKTAPDFDDARDENYDNNYVLRIRATGPGGQTFQFYSVTVTNISELPEFYGPSTRERFDGYDEGMTITAHDTTSFSMIGGEDISKFSLDPTTGVLTFLAIPDFASPGDFDADNEYHVTVRATGPGGFADRNFTIFISEFPTARCTEYGADDILGNLPTNTHPTIDYKIEGMNLAGDKWVAQFARLMCDSNGVQAGRWYSVKANRGASGTLVFDTNYIETNLRHRWTTVAVSSLGFGDEDVGQFYFDIDKDSATIFMVVNYGLIRQGIRFSSTWRSNDYKDVFNLDGNWQHSFDSLGTSATLISSTWDNYNSGVSALGVQAPTGDWTNTATPTYIEDQKITDAMFGEIVFDIGSSGFASPIRVKLSTRRGTGINPDWNDVPAPVAPEIIGPTKYVVNDGVMPAFQVNVKDRTFEPTYTISGGADAALFTVDARGFVNFKVATNYSAPTDAGANNKYDLQITATNDQGADSETYEITVIGVSGVVGPIQTLNFSGSGTTDPTSLDNTVFVKYVGGGGEGVSAFNKTWNSGQLGHVFVDYTDASPNGESIAISIGDSVLNISDLSDTAIIEFTVRAGLTLDLEKILAPLADNDTSVGVESHTLDFTYNDSISDQFGRVTFTNGEVWEFLRGSNWPAPTAPVFTGATAHSLTTGYSNPFTATANPNTYDLNFAITGGADAAVFNITYDGTVTFIVPPDFSAPIDAGANNVYDLEITATNETGSTVQAFTVTVNDFTLPVFNGPFALNVDEEQTDILTVDVQFNDYPPTFSIVSGVDEALFAVDNITGVVTFIAAPDFLTPLDVGANNVYDFEVTATNPAGDQTQAYVITVDQLPLPVFTGTFILEISEGSAAFTAVATNTPTFAITGGLDQSLFDIVPATGVVTFSPAVLFASPTDNGANNVYDVEITATNLGGSVAQAYAITIRDPALVQEIGIEIAGDPHAEITWSWSDAAATKDWLGETWSNGETKLVHDEFAGANASGFYRGNYSVGSIYVGGSVNATSGNIFAYGSSIGFMSGYGNLNTGVVLVSGTNTMTLLMKASLT
jgi:hypothetical protein